jgi:hypothetical protein
LLHLCTGSNRWKKYFRHESLHLSASVSALLNQPFTAVQHGLSEVYCWTAWVFHATLFQICLPKNVVENFSRSLQENQFQADKIYITWSISWKQLDHCETKSQLRNEMCWQKRHWTTLVLDLKLHQETLLNDEHRRQVFW